MLNLKKQVHHAPRCPRCHYTLPDNFGASRPELCPECGTTASRADSLERVSRVRFLLVGILATLIAPPILMFAVMLALYTVEELGERETIVVIPLFILMSWQLFTPAVIYLRYRSRRVHLRGSYARPSALATLITLAACWLLTTLIVLFLVFFIVM